MKTRQQAALPPEQLAEVARLANALVRLRHARRVTQADAALRAGLSLGTAKRLEKGDAGVAIGGLLRYLNAIAPGLSLERLLAGDDPSLAALEIRERGQRVRRLSSTERDELDF